MNRVHLFCPNLIDTRGTIEFEEDVHWGAVVQCLSEPGTELVWRSSWSGVLAMLQNHTELDVPNDGQRRETISAHQPMQTGETGIIFRTIEKMDLKSPDLKPEDFVFTICLRVK